MNPYVSFLGPDGWVLWSLLPPEWRIDEEFLRSRVGASPDHYTTKNYARRYQQRDQDGSAEAWVQRRWMRVVRAYDPDRCEVAVPWGSGVHLFSPCAFPPVVGRRCHTHSVPPRSVQTDKDRRTDTAASVAEPVT